MSTRSHRALPVLVVLATAGAATAGSLQIDSASAPARPGRSRSSGLQTGGCFDSGPSRQSGAETLGSIVVGSIAGTAMTQAMRSSSLPGSLRNLVLATFLDVYQSVMAPLTSGFMLLTPAPSPSLLGSSSQVPGLWWLGGSGIVGLSAVPGVPHLSQQELLGGSTTGEGTRAAPGSSKPPTAGLELCLGVDVR